MEWKTTPSRWFKPHTRWRKLRITGLAIAFLAALLTTLYAIHHLLLPIIAWLFPALVTPFYDLGVWGFYPTQKFVTFDGQAPVTKRLRWDSSCDGGYVLISPNGDSVPQPGPMILDSRGELVWMSGEFGTTMNLELQRFQGEEFLTFWAGSKDGSMGQGSYYMLDHRYDVVQRVGAVGEGMHGDLHEFRITENDTALMTVYQKSNADLSAMGRPVEGWITDSGFQEVDIRSGELVFEWDASKHFHGNDSYMTHPFAGYWESIPFDFYHLNSIDKDSKGNYLISSRHFHSVTCLSPTGEVLWVFGGRYSDFTDLSDGKASTFRWQHDARWLNEEEGILTLFDNEDAGPLHMDAHHSKAMKIRLDVESRTAELLATYTSLQQTRAPSQGSVQELPSGNMFIGWGASAAYTEHNPSGELLCETHFGAGHLFWWGMIKSYRAYKVDWKGDPTYPPSIKIKDNNLYVSWNGATEVASWELQGSREKDKAFERIDEIEKQGFESHFALPSSAATAGFSYYKVAALDKGGNVLGVSRATTLAPPSGAKSLSVAAGVLVVVALAVVGAWYGMRLIIRRRGFRGNKLEYEYSRI